MRCMNTGLDRWIWSPSISGTSNSLSSSFLDAWPSLEGMLSSKIHSFCDKNMTLRSLWNHSFTTACDMLRFSGSYIYLYSSLVAPTFRGSIRSRLPFRQVFFLSPLVSISCPPCAIDKTDSSAVQSTRLSTSHQNEWVYRDYILCKKHSTFA